MAQAQLPQKTTAKVSETPSTAALMRLTGYGLLLLGLFDVIAAFIPVNFTNPIWEFQFLGELVERSIVPLMGLALAFYGEREGRLKFERPLLPLLSWLSLLAGIAYFALVPLGISDAWKINQANNQQVSAQVTQKMDNINKAKDALKKATPADLDSAFAALKKRGMPKDIKSPQIMKTKMAENFATVEKKLNEDSEKAAANLRVALLKNSTKWNLGALLSGILFVSAWRITRWSRRRAPVTAPQ
jgi:hypothetical protein